MKILDAERLHQVMMSRADMVPAVPCSEKKTAQLDKMTMGSKQYPSTLATQPYDTPEELIKFSKA